VALPPPASRVRTRNSTWKTREDENAEPESPTLEKSPTEQLQEQTFIGPSVSIKGELSSKEDLIIQGRVEGEIDLKKNNVNIGKKGHVKGDIYGRIISIEGEVQGNLFGEEKIVVRESAMVLGDIETPRFSIGEGAKFKGHIDVIPGLMALARASSKPWIRLIRNLKV
jgi:cytoskeletal protein CcmA (bactofilin family)